MNNIYDVLTISRYIINKCNEESFIISNLKLQKLLYFVQGFNLALNNRSCFDDVIQAWDYGPVCPRAYYEYKKYGASNIPFIQRYYELVFFDNDDFDWIEREFDENEIDVDTKAIIDAVIDGYASYSATSLVDITHKQLPWRKTYYSNPSKKNVEIKTSLIREYFKSLIH